MVPLCATLMLAFAVGMTIAPLTGSFTMELFGPNGLFYHSIFFNLVFITFALYRMTQRAAPTQGTVGYVNVPASSVAISQLNPRSAHPEIDESLEAVFGHDPDDPESGDEIPHYKPSTK